MLNLKEALKYFARGYLMDVAFVFLGFLLFAAPVWASEALKVGEDAELLVSGDCLISPSARARAAFGVTKGELVKVKEIEAGWAQVVNIKGKSGWVPVKSLKKAETQPAKAAEISASAQVPSKANEERKSESEPTQKEKISEAPKKELAKRKEEAIEQSIEEKSEPPKSESEEPEAKLKQEKKVLASEEGETTETSVNESAETEEREKNYFSVSLLIDVLIPTSRVNTTYAFHLGFRYIFPFWNPHLFIGAEVGYLPLSGKGKNLDAQIGLYDFEWKITSVPVFAGLGVEHPLLWEHLILFGEVGFAYIAAWSKGRTFGGEVKQNDYAMGFYAGGGAELRFLPFGGAVVSVRYSDARLDFNYPEYNLELGIIGGTSVLVGYRFTY